jgi:hypothetical protein
MAWPFTRGIKHSRQPKDRGIFPCGVQKPHQDEPMNSALWIALGAALLVVLAHAGLFWWFICKGRKNDDESGDR